MEVPRERRRVISLRMAGLDIGEVMRCNSSAGLLVLSMELSIGLSIELSMGLGLA